MSLNNWNQTLSALIGICLYFNGDVDRSFYLLSPSSGRRPWSGDYKTLFVRASVCASFHPSVCPFVTFLHKPNISFIYKDIFIKFARNVYGYENMSVKNFGLILKSTMAAIANYLKII